MKNADTDLKCPECGKDVKAADVICMSCGSQLKFSGNKKISFVQSNTQDARKSALQPSALQTKKGSGNKPYHTFLDLLFLIFTVLFSYLYLFDFSLFFKIPEKLLNSNHLSLTQAVYNAYNFISLSKYHADISFRLRQLKFEEKMSRETSNNRYLGLKFSLIDCYNDKKNITRLKIDISNQSLYTICLRDIYFFYKTADGIYPAFLNGQETGNKPYILNSWKSYRLGLSFKNLNLKNSPLNGKIIFNNGKKYAIQDLILKI